MSEPVLRIILASTRPQRVGLIIATWFESLARSHGAFDVQVADLAEIGLPLLDEPNHPRLRRYSHDHTKAWSETIDCSDAFAIVMPEYNHGYNAALKNALDYLFFEWNNKPVGTISYGGIAAGTRAVQALKPVLLALSMMPVAKAVAIPFFPQFLHSRGGTRTFEPGTETDDSAREMLDALASSVALGQQLRRGSISED